MDHAIANAKLILIMYCIKGLLMLIIINYALLLLEPVLKD